MNEENTIRQEIYDWLLLENISIKKVSEHFGIPFTRAVHEVEHVIKSAKVKGKKLEIVPAECSKCQFVFKDRTKLLKPSRCPKCRGERILEPLFGLV